MRRLLLLILGFLATWLGTTLPAEAAADLPTHPELVQAYTYDTVGAAAPRDATNERGPPSDYTIRYAADHGSCGATACQYASPTPVTYHYDHPIKLAQIAHDAGDVSLSSEFLSRGRGSWLALLTVPFAQRSPRDAKAPEVGRSKAKRLFDPDGPWARG